MLDRQSKIDGYETSCNRLRPARQLASTFQKNGNYVWKYLALLAIDLPTHLGRMFTSAGKRQELNGNDREIPEVVAKWIMRSLQHKEPQPGVAIGRGAGLLASLVYLPANLRDRLLLIQFGNAAAINRMIAGR